MQKSSTKETYILQRDLYYFKHATNHGHPIVVELSAHELVSFSILIIGCVIIVHCGVLQIMSMWVLVELTARDMVS